MGKEDRYMTAKYKEKWKILRIIITEKYI